MFATIFIILSVLVLLVIAVFFDVLLGQALWSALRGKDLPRSHSGFEFRRYGTSRDGMRCP
jgi:hypothetical protein